MGSCAARRLRGGSSGASGGTRSNNEEPPPAAPSDSSSSSSKARRCGDRTAPFAPPLHRVAMFVARGRAAPCGTDGAAPPPGQNVQCAPPRRPATAPRTMCSPPSPPPHSTLHHPGGKPGPRDAGVGESPTSSIGLAERVSEQPLRARKKIEKRASGKRARLKYRM